MSDKTGIAWTDATWNPATGCTKVSPGCKYCYAKHQAWPRLSKNPQGVYTGRHFEDVQVHTERLDQPLRWTKPRMIFVNSMSDLFHEQIPDEFITNVFNVMAMAPQHRFQILTKRSNRMKQYMNNGSLPLRLNNNHVFYSDSGPVEWPLPNVWLGVSVENQDAAIHRIPHLIETPATVRWLSCEPLLGPISLGDWLPGLEWVVVGGESGPEARPMDPQWAMDISLDCQTSDTAFFMKQLSQNNNIDIKNIETFPAELKIREYPL